MGTSANAVKIQVWTALIAILILRYLQLKSEVFLVTVDLVALLRMTCSPIEICGDGSTNPLEYLRRFRRHTTKRF